MQKNNRNTDILLIDGFNVIKEAFNAGLKLHTFFYAEESVFDEDFSEFVCDLPEECLCKIPKWNLSSITSVQTNRGVAALFFKPKLPPLKNISMGNDGWHLPVTLICDNIRDPGNLGTIIRSAAAANCNSIILTDGCANPWQPKVMRSASGSHFHLAIYCGVTWRQINGTRALRSKSLYLAECRRNQNSYSQNGDKISKIAGEKEIIPYYDVDWTNKSGALIAIGNEAHGFNLNAQFISEISNIVQHITIPLCHQIQSLNVATAASIILFEASRQLNMKRN